MKEAEQRTSEALRHASKEHSTKLDVQIANLARVQKQADDCQLELAAKEAQVAELQSRLDGVTAQLEGIRHAPNSAAELQQALTAKDAQIAELQSSREASMGYRKLCVTLSQECKNLRAQLQGQGKQPVSSSRLDSDPSTTSTPVMRGGGYSRNPPSLHNLQRALHSETCGSCCLALPDSAVKVSKKCFLLLQTALHSATTQPMSEFMQQRQERMRQST
jgi:hypothetical protein